MNNFTYETPTKLIFGRDVVAQLPQVLEPYGRRVLLAYGGGSIKRMGLYDRVKQLLAGFEVVELAGIEPNPKYSTSVVDGVRLCKEHGIDVILAVGGGSVLDCCKAIAGGAKYDGDTWDLIIGKVPTTDALPIVDILTLAATGSEFDAGGVISRTETNDKVGYIAPALYPKVSLLDPTYTLTVPARQIAAGTADAINHVMEQYFALPVSDLAAGFCEGMFKALIKWAPIAQREPDNYEAHAQHMLACTFGCNGLLSLGMGQSGWPMHGIEHALSAYYDITHGEGLAIITPHWMRKVLNERTMPRFVAFAVNVMGVDPNQPDAQVAEQGIQAITRFYTQELGIPATLREVGIDDSRLEEMAHHIATLEGLDNEQNFAPLTQADILDILKAAL